MGTARFAVGPLAVVLSFVLASCAGASRDHERSVSIVGHAPTDVTAAWDAQHAAAKPAEPLVRLDAQWAIHEPLPLRVMDARVVVQGPLALTELHLVFENTTDHLIEANQNKLVVPSWARFELRVPRGGAVARFALEGPDGWREAEMVAVSHDRPCFAMSWTPKLPPELTDETREQPALFGANIEPISPHSRTSVVVTFTQTLGALGDPYRLPLLGLPRLERLDAVVRFPLDPARKAVSVHKQDWTPDRDWVVDPPPAAPTAIRSGRFVVARVARAVEAANADPPAHLALLIDTSASRGDRLRADADRVSGILRELGRTAPRTTVDVAVFDQDVQSVASGLAANMGPLDVSRLMARGALGPTNLGAALRWGARQRVDRVVLVSDGVPTLDARTVSDLAPALDALRTAGAKRLDAMSADGRGAELLEALTLALDEPGTLWAADEAPAATVARLTHATVEPIDVPGASWSWPKDTRAGSPVVVFAELSPGTPLDVRLSGRSIPLETRQVASPLVDHEAARVEVTRLESAHPEVPASEPADADPARAPLVELSTRYRVISREGRWIVPVSEQQIAQLGVDRTTSPVLAVGATDVEATPRAPAHLLPARRAECRPGPAKTNAGWSDMVGRGWSVPDHVVLEKGREGFSRAELGNLKDKLKDLLFHRNPSPGSLEVEGYCSDFPTELENLRVSRERANTLHKQLLELGIDARVRGYGSMPPSVGFFEYEWTDGAGPLEFRRDPSRIRNTFGWMGPNNPALGVAQRGEIAVRLVQKDPPKAIGATSAPFTGKLAEVLSAPDQGAARDAAEAWYARAMSDPVASLALGLTRERAGDTQGAARAFGSLLDLAPGSATVGRATAAFLERENPSLGLEVLEETAGLEADQSMTSRWDLGVALARAGKLTEAAGTLASTLDAWMSTRNLTNGDKSDFRELGRVFAHSPTALDVLEQELSVVAAAAASAHPDQKDALEARLAPYGIELATRPSLRFVLTWDSEADVDLQVESGKRPWDPEGSSSRVATPGEGLVLDDVRAYGPEEYIVQGAARAFPYRALAHLHGPAGNVMGRVDVLDYDGRGHLAIEERPFVVQAEGGTVEVVTVQGAL